VIFDVVIVGAGIVGAACADECARAGMKVAVVDAGIACGGATAAGMGHLLVLDDSEAQFALTRLSRDLWRTLASELPDGAEYLECGTLWIAADDDEMVEVRRKLSYYGERGVAVEELDGKALAEAEPSLRPGLAGALRIPEDAVSYPPCAARFLLERAGATLMTGRRVTAVSDDGATCENGDRIAAGAVVNATGTAAAKLTPGVPVQARKGHLLITDRYPGYVHSALIELGYIKSAHSIGGDSVAFNAQPRRTGQVLIGSSRQYGVTSARIDRHMLDAMLRRAVEYLPGLRSLSAIRTWAGFRAATPDKLPVIGRVPGRRNVYIATGHEGLGITTSLGTARLLVDEMTGRESPIPREPYAWRFD
jgi:glycine/D-amino acid oxidase-like deaminating enzyme